MAFIEAVRKFEAVCERYSRFGAADTEPDMEFQYLIRQLSEGEEPKVPDTAEGWQLFSDMPGAQGVARRLAVEARRVIAAGKKDHVGLMRYAREELWRC